MTDVISTDKKPKQFRYSEMFSSIQGEGQYCGVPTTWLRLWGCNLECKAFGQTDVDDSTTWDLPYLSEDISKIATLEELPVWHTGCDSSYSWSKKFKHLAHIDTAEGIAEKLIELNKSPYNMGGLFCHEKSKQETHMGFTGGEPMMNQRAIVDVMEALYNKDKNFPINVTVETNGTQPIKEVLIDYLKNRFLQYENVGGIKPIDRGASEWFWSVSPKLRTSGEKWEDAIKPEVLEQYQYFSDNGQLKFVVDNDHRTWYEVEKATAAYREKGINWPVWVMPVGADLEMQSSHAETICREAIARGYNFAPRVHVNVFGNRIGT